MKLSLYPLLLCAFACIAAACTPTNAPAGSGGVPESWIDAPLNNSTLALAPISIVSHSGNPSTITQVELSVNGQVVQTDPNPDSLQTLVVMSQEWTPDAPGNYTLRVRAQNAGGIWGNYAQVVVTVTGATLPAEVAQLVPQTATPTSSTTDTPMPVSFTSTATAITAPTQTNTPLLTAPNTATSTTRNTATRIPTARTLPTKTATFIPTPLPTRTNTPLPPAGCVGTPNITSFTASPASIFDGQSSTLSWGAVTNASAVVIDQNIFGVATPGSASVTPGSTTTYTLTAFCGRTIAQRQVTVTVNNLAPINQGPTIGTPAFSTNLIYYQDEPGCGAQGIQITVAAADSDGVARVTLFYRYADKFSNKTTNWGSANMLTRGGWTYFLNAPGYRAVQYGSAWVQIYFVAADTKGATTTSPTYGNSVTLTTCKP